MIVSLQAVLDIAEAKKTAIAAFNVTNMESIMAAIAAAETLGQPLILQFCSSVHGKYVPMADIGPVMMVMAEKSTAPICVHLDHGETFEEIREALEIGFTGVMYDGSMLPYEQNVANTKLVVELAAGYGAQVEAELGAIARDEYSSVERTAHDAEAAIFTDPDQAQDFVKKTGVAGVACSFGAVHGIYLKEPHLDFERISRLHEKMGAAVIMHGGSGIPDADIQECIRRGVRKINFYTYAARDAGTLIKENLNKLAEGDAYFHHISVWGRESMTKTFTEAMKVFSMQ